MHKSYLQTKVAKMEGMQAHFSILENLLSDYIFMLLLYNNISQCLQNPSTEYAYRVYLNTIC